MRILLYISSVVLAVASTALAEEPAQVAIHALTAWRANDGVALEAIAHSELKQHVRRYLQSDGTDISRMSDGKVFQMLGDSLKMIYPPESNIEFFERVISVEERGEYCIVRL